VPIRYYFDIRDGSELYPDEEGMDLPNQMAAGVEAAQSLADMAKGTVQFDRRRAMTIEVRTGSGSLFRAAFILGNTAASPKAAR
jgi:uncharacterized protein DUF6894